MTATLSLADVVTGKNLSFSAPLRRTCPHCGGSGARSQEEVQECPACTGTGYRMHVHRGASGAFLQGFNTSCDLCEGHGSRPTAPCPVCEGQRYTTAEGATPMRCQPLSIPRCSLPPCLTTVAAEHTVAIPAGAPAGYQIRLGGHVRCCPLPSLVARNPNPALSGPLAPPVRSWGRAGGGHARATPRLPGGGRGAGGGPGSGHYRVAARV